MSTALQEWLALALVAVVVGLYAWRRWRRRHAGTPACGGCASAPDSKQTEKTIRFYRRS
jgi:hypothetical protein